MITGSNNKKVSVLNDNQVWRQNFFQIMKKTLQINHGSFVVIPTQESGGKWDRKLRKGRVYAEGCGGAISTIIKLQL